MGRMRVSDGSGIGYIFEYNLTNFSKFTYESYVGYTFEFYKFPMCDTVTSGLQLDMKNSSA